MLKSLLTIQDSGTGRVSVIANQLAAIGATAQFDRLRVAVAYATLSGCKDLVERLKDKTVNWHALQKRWLVSMDFGRTEAKALEYLRRLPNSEVRVPEAEYLLSSALIPRRCFHPKTFVFDCGPEGARAPFAIVVGSGNLTLSGLNTGIEHATSVLWKPPLYRRERAVLRSVQSELGWWDEVWPNACPADEQLIARYRKLRPANLREDEAHSVRPFARNRRREIEANPGLAWANATCFWIQTQELYKNLGLERPGNQLDLRRGTRVYFGFPPDSVPRNTVLGSVGLQYRNRPPHLRSMRFGNNSMDKINLPIPGDDGPESYDHAVVHFEHTGGNRFRVTLGGRRDFRKWRRKSLKQNMLFELVGGREFGFYN